MRTKQRLDLSTFDGQLLDGLDFCSKVYDLFDQLQNEPDGVAKLRLRPTLTEKRLIEELLPIAHYVQARYRAGLRIKVRWFSGSQPYDAILSSSGGLVKHGAAPRKLFLEVTIAVHRNDYFRRKLLQERGGSFGVKGISRDKKTREIVSKPYVHTSDEPAADLAGQIIKAITAKVNKYPPATVLIVNCVTDGLIYEPEWNDAIERVTKAQLHPGFWEVFLLEPITLNSATLYGDRKRRRRKADSGVLHPHTSRKRGKTA